MKWIPSGLYNWFDSKMTKWENRGFHAANKMHKFGVNCALVFIMYNIYAFLRDYNNFFLHARQLHELEKPAERDNDGPINADASLDDDWILFKYGSNLALEYSEWTKLQLYEILSRTK